MFNAIPMACLSRFCVTKTLASEVSTTQCLTQVTEEQEALPSGSDGAAFDWLKQWYPLAAAEDLDPDRPMLNNSWVRCSGAAGYPLNPKVYSIISFVTALYRSEFVMGVGFQVPTRQF